MNTSQQPVPSAQTHTIELPAPRYPMVTRMISKAPFPDDNGKDDPVKWEVTKAHPLLPVMRVVRMFIFPGGIEVYSVSPDGKDGMRNLVPISRVLLVEEFMPLSVFVEELRAAENEGLDDDDDDAPAPMPAEPEPAAPNGQNASS